MPRPNYRRAHRVGDHSASPNKDCTFCTQERAAASLIESHLNGEHAKVPRQKCPSCAAARAQQWKKQV